MSIMFLHNPDGLSRRPGKPIEGWHISSECILFPIASFVYWKA